MTNSEIRLLNEAEFPLWDDFVDEAQHGTLFHKTFWLGALGYKPMIYGYFKEGQICAGLPLTYHREFGLKMVVHPPITPYMGVIFKHPNTKYATWLSNEKKISREIAQILKKNNHYVSLRFPPGMVDLQPFIWEGFSTSVTYTYIIYLENDLDKIWMSMNAINRNRIRKAEKDGITVVASDDFNDTVKLIEMTFARQEIQSFPKSAAYTYSDILKTRNRFKSFLAKDVNNNLIAGTYLAWDNKSSYYLLGGYNSENSHRGALALALWESIKFSKEKLNLKEFNFEGSMIPRIEEFFRAFGGELVPCYHVEWTKKPYKILLSVRQRLARSNFMRSLYATAYLRT